GHVDAEWIVLHYQPFSYGRWGFAPALIAAAAGTRRHGDQRLALMVHEAWVPMVDWRSTLMGLWQRADVGALVRMAAAAMASTEALSRTTGGAVPMPIPANIVTIDTTPTAARSRLGLDGKLAVALFGRDHESRALDHADRAIAA